MLDYEDKPKKKKKHDKSKETVPKAKPIRNFKIIDDDIGLGSCMASIENEAMVELINGADAPIVVSDFKDVVEKDLKLVKKVDYFTNDTWVKIDVCEDEYGDMVIPESSSKSLFKKRGEKKTAIKTEDSDSDLDIPRINKSNKHDSDSDLDTIPRKSTAKQGSDDDMDDVPRRQTKIKKEKYSDDDISPMRSKHIEEEIVDETKCRVRKKSKLEVLKEEEVKRKKEEKLIKYMEWGKGLVQKQQREEKLQSDLHEADKPLARYQDDKDLDRLLKSQEREDDPMAEYIRNKVNENEDGTQIKKNVAKYKGPPAPPNRYGLQPGARWDGVDRSNGFEKRFYESINAKKVRDEAAYKWSVEDM